MKKIIVAGAGHGGIAAATLLAREGFDVTIYEKKQRNELGYDQVDSVHLDGFERSGVPVPEQYMVQRTGIAFRLPGQEHAALKQGVKEGTMNIEIPRKALYDWLIGPAEEAGVKFVYGVTVEGPVVLGSRVAGLKTSAGDVLADLVIDAAGVYSPVRSNLPESFGIQSGPSKYEVLHPRRYFFSRDPEAGEPENVYSVTVLPTPFCGIMWAIVKDDEVDVLLAAFEDLSDEDYEEKLAQLKAVTPQIGELRRGGRLPDIPSRQPLSMLVADGYAAIGDAAFMTVPLKGSGVGHSLRAGKMLAETVIADKNGFFNRETLWPYQVRFFKAIGFGSALMAVLKNEMPTVTLDSLEYIFTAGIVSPELLEQFGSEAGFAKILMNSGIKELTDMGKKIVGHQALRRTIMRGASGLGRCKLVERGMKEKYESRTATKWAKNYDAFFASILKRSLSEAQRIKTGIADASVPEDED